MPDDLNPMDWNGYPPKTYAELRVFLNQLRKGVETVGNKIHRIPEHLVEQDVWNMVHSYMRSRGEFFRAAYPWYFDRQDNLLVRIDSPTPELSRILREMGLLPNQKHTTIILNALCDVGDIAPERPLHRFAFMADEAIYLRRTASSMIRIRSDKIEEVPLGTDGVVLIADDLPDWPSLAELQPHISALERLVGRTCVDPLPGLPMSDLLTTRWDRESTFTPEQAQRMFLAWLLFPTVGSAYPLWPILTHTGPQNSGKSTPLELWLAALSGVYVEATALPKKERDLIASATNQTFLIYDNVDGAQARDYDDFLCNLATGARVNLARLYKTNSLATFRLRNHVALTARVCPFTRSDVMRRMIVLDVAPSSEDHSVKKSTLIRRVLEQRPAIFAEYLLRTRNILRAHLEVLEREYDYQSQMSEYEAYMLRCAEYDGTFEKACATWNAYSRQYEQSVTESNPLVFAVRVWLGKGGNAGREVSPATLLSEIQTIFRDLDQALSYRSSGSFGMHIAKNKSALQVIGFATVPTRSNHAFIFSPSPEELARCTALYNDLAASSTARAVSTLSSSRWNGIPMSLEDDDTSDLDDPVPSRGVIQ